ncbi:MAG: sugar dehydrogenase complex small subunit [Zymomonas mobilis subsp. pomaceae]|uniref:Membrane bound FAD containing D-sorbitol dehydrogenase n=1 Tax=Zymomonas mobilis subsp. pomaceae (strain ATCC 29192 / DSM 22645 / JCM 10191 / CCUG 17912 / NBRC 13757 / NCIMB 11200 / NRRL B-4491 / Barker I) TaxID=579138 RepID=F8EVG0_ZYMMT|nr:sugar dehydrogenase complex small subunit [Zymomonas mobilis]AEI37367.1 hypothetical protein Zymop_0464 [Zymomonas mobilis subsp. pomaceae ATCC 29192]MDX5948735.1 sugar dehydrogenase complex small subunit [Zymomonas mobilis subsp. pomaceae]GEB88540.1 hypothetical protein ZMO02_01770 [Zymomonas mobilis subsp. pomaceae]
MPTNRKSSEEIPSRGEGTPTNRRQFLKVAGFSAGTAIAAGTAPLLAQDNNDKPLRDQFYSLSTFLTGHNDLDRGLSDRTWDALLAVDSDFSVKSQALRQAIAAAAITDSSLLRLSAIGQDDALMTTAKTIISAWYLGYVGTPAGHAMEDNARFISYSSALMYRPTLDATVIPSYARGGPSYWVNPPATIKQD